MLLEGNKKFVRSFLNTLPEFEVDHFDFALLRSNNRNSNDDNDQDNYENGEEDDGGIDDNDDNDNNDNDVPTLKPDLDEDELKFSDGVNTVGFKLFLAVSKTEANAVVAPVSFFTMMSMLFLGSRGTTSEQINELIHLVQIS